MRGDHGPLGDQAPHRGFDVAMMHGLSLSKFGAGDGERQLRGQGGGGAERACAETAARSSSPNRSGRLRNSSCSMDGIDQQRSVFGAHNFVDQRERLRWASAAMGQYAAPCGRRAPARTPRHSTTAASRNARRVRRARALRSKPMARRSCATNVSRSMASDSDGGASALVDIACSSRSRLSCSVGCKAQRTIDGGARRRRVEPSRRGLASPPPQGRHRPALWRGRGGASFPSPAPC